MSVTPASFRGDFPEFAATDLYPDSQVSFWLTLATELLPFSRWGSLVDYGVELFAAHNLALSRLAGNTANAGGVAGVGTGLVASKSVGPLSVSYDTAAGRVDGAGAYNLTTYGTRLWQLMRMFGAGGVYVGPQYPLPGTIIDNPE